MLQLPPMRRGSTSCCSTDRGARPSLLVGRTQRCPAICRTVFVSMSSASGRLRRAPLLGCSGSLLQRRPRAGDPVSQHGGQPEAQHRQRAAEPHRRRQLSLPLASCVPRRSVVRRRGVLLPPEPLALGSVRWIQREYSLSLTHTVLLTAVPCVTWGSHLSRAAAQRSSRHCPAQAAPNRWPPVQRREPAHPKASTADRPRGAIGVISPRMQCQELALRSSDGIFNRPTVSKNDCPLYVAFV